MEQIRMGDEWEGFETIVAVKYTYKVNCVSFDIDNRTSRMPNFEKLYHGNVFVALKDFNHYDPVINIKYENISEIAWVPAQ